MVLAPACTRGLSMFLSLGSSLNSQTEGLTHSRFMLRIRSRQVLNELSRDGGTILAQIIHFYCANATTYLNNTAGVWEVRIIFAQIIPRYCTSITTYLAKLKGGAGRSESSSLRLSTSIGLLLLAAALADAPFEVASCSKSMIS
jgi:hypothetical protein